MTVPLLLAWPVACSARDSCTQPSITVSAFDTVIGMVKFENNLPTKYWWVGQWQGGEFYGVGPATNEGARAPIIPKPAWKAE